MPYDAPGKSCHENYLDHLPIWIAYCYFWCRCANIQACQWQDAGEILQEFLSQAFFTESQEEQDI